MACVVLVAPSMFPWKGWSDREHAHRGITKIPSGSKVFNKVRALRLKLAISGLMAASRYDPGPEEEGPLLKEESCRWATGKNKQDANNGGQDTII